MSAEVPAPRPANEQKNNLGIWALVLGILSIVCCAFFAGIPAIIIGLKSKQAEAAGLANNGSLGNVGFILGIVGSVLGTLGWIFYITLIALSDGVVA